MGLIDASRTGITTRARVVTVTAEFRPVTDEECEKIRELHAKGESLSSIARQLDRAPGTLAPHAKRMGLAFDRSQTAAATKAKTADNRARRAQIIADLYEIAADEIEYLRRDGGYNLTEVSAGQAVDYWTERLPAQDRKALVGAISTSMSSAVRLEQVDAENGADGAKAMLLDLAAALRGRGAGSGEPEES